MKVLVTGGAGFVGSHLVRALLAADPATRVTVLDKLTYAGNPANLATVAGDPRYRFVHGDICDAEVVDGLVAGHDALLHLAAESHVDRSIRRPAPFVTTNLVGTQVLLDAAVRRRLGRFVVVSTDEVYGSIESGVWTEQQPLAPTSPYAATKAGADLLALAYHRTYGLDVVLTRGANTYGPNQYPEKLIPLFVTNLLDGRPVPLYGDGGNVRDWLHVTDVCHALRLVLAGGRAGAAYHIGGGTELTNRDLVGRLLAECGADWTMVRQVADRPGHDRRYALDATRIRTELGWTPKVGFDAGLRDTVAWYRANRAWWEPVKARRQDELGSASGSSDASVVLD